MRGMTDNPSENLEVRPKLRILDKVSFSHYYSFVGSELTSSGGCETLSFGKAEKKVKMAANIEADDKKGLKTS